MSKIAICPACTAPLVSTFHWRKKEFYCLDCGRLWDWLQPFNQDETPDNLARMEAYIAEWCEHAGARLVTVGAWREDCPLCKDPATGRMLDSHDHHATPEEWAAHGEAIDWIRGRVKVPA